MILLDNKSPRRSRLFGHVGVKSPNEVADDLPQLGTIPSSCSICAKANIPRDSFPHQSNTRATRVLERVHMDICGKLSHGIGNAWYYLLIVDDFSRFSIAYTLNSRDEAVKYFKNFQKHAENIHNTKIRTIRCDNAPEFVKGAFRDYALEQGINFETTVPHTPQQNGVAERHNGTFGNMIRAMLLDADLSDWFWPLALHAAVYTRNRLPHKALPPHSSPYQAWFGTKPTLSHLRPFGAPCVAKVLPASSLSKFQPRGESGRFVGYSKTAKGYLFWDPKSKSVKTKRELDFRIPNPSIGSGGLAIYDKLKPIWGRDHILDNDPLNPYASAHKTPPLAKLTISEFTMKDLNMAGESISAHKQNAS